MLYSVGKGFLSIFGLKVTNPESNHDIISQDVGSFLGKVVKSIPDFLVAGSGHPAAIIHVVRDCVDITESVSTIYDHLSIIGHGYNQLNETDE